MMQVQQVRGQPEPLGRSIRIQSICFGSFDCQDAEKCNLVDDISIPRKLVMFSSVSWPLKSTTEQ